MDWKSLLTSEIENAYKAADGLLGMVEDDQLDWKPASGDNWMTTGQLIEHLKTACGFSCRGFVTGDWGMPDGTDLGEMSPEEMLPPAEALPAAASVAEVRAALAEDKKLALEVLGQAADRFDEPTPAPWDPRPTPLGQRMLEMVGHLNIHRAQLFYYLKLQGKPVNTMHLWGMA